MEPIFLFELQEYNFWEKYSKEGVAYNTITSVILIRKCSDVNVPNIIRERNKVVRKLIWRFVQYSMGGLNWRYLQPVPTDCGNPTRKVSKQK